MIYQIIKTFEDGRSAFDMQIDDCVFLSNQPKAFQELFNELQEGNCAEFDNCTAIYLPETDRILFTLKESEVHDEQ